VQDWVELIGTPVGADQRAGADRVQFRPARVIQGGRENEKAVIRRWPRWRRQMACHPAAGAEVL